MITPLIPANLKVVLEIAILWFAIYRIIIIFDGTKAIQVVRGIIIILAVFLFLGKLGFRSCDWLFTNFLAISVVAVLIIFHHEIRQVLARLGQKRLFKVSLREKELSCVLGEVNKALEVLSHDKFGALIVIEKNDSLAAYIDSGISIDAKVSSELIQAIFTPNNPLHDGGIIIRNQRIVSAGSIFPLTEKQDVNRIFGMRHRAALGLSEETDAVIIAISEERQDLSLVYNSKLYSNLTKDELISKTKEFLISKTDSLGLRKSIMDNFISLFTYQFWFKAISLILSILLWFYINEKMLLGR